MTQHEKILAYMLLHPKTGITIAEAVRLGYANWPHKRIAEMERMGVKIVREYIKPEGGARFVRYTLADLSQPIIRQILGGKKTA